jgi:hypothetical protein
MKRLLVVATIFILFAVPATGTQIISLNPKEMGAKSDLVVLGRVQSVGSYWNPDKTRIYTEVVVSVEETYKGQPVGSIRIVQIGGQVGNVRVSVAGAPLWIPDREVLLFLGRVDTGLYAITGFSQGKLDVTRENATGKVFVRPATASEADNPGLQHINGGSMTVEEFVSDALGGEER